MFKGTCRYLHFGSNRYTFSSSESSAIKLASFSSTTFQQSWDESTNLTALHRIRKTIPHPPCRPHRRCNKTDNESSIQTMYRWSKAHPFHFHRRTQTNFETTIGTTPPEKSSRGCPPSTQQSQLFRARRKQIPPLPKTVADIRLEGKWSETGQPVLLLDDTFHSNRIIVYATPDNLQDFAASEMFFCDGTFYTCPGLDDMENWRGWHSTLTKHLHRYQDLQGHTEHTKIF